MRPSAMTVLQAYGHTPGATSFSFQVTDAGKTYNVLIVNMNGINAGVKLLGSPGYPTIAEDFKNTLAIQATYTPDVWVSSHSGQYNLRTVYKPGDAYNPARFGDLAAYKAKIAEYQAAYEKQLAEERAPANQSEFRSTGITGRWQTSARARGANLRLPT
jgi:metallo-beta-lactamase class B